MEIAFVFLLGLCFGSFVTMASHRLPRDMEIVKTRSHCTKCQAVLGVLDLFPVVSWVRSGGKCRHCGARISWRYPLTELVCGLLFVIVFMQYGLTMQGILLMLFSAALLCMLVADLETGLIPDEIHFFLLPLGIGYHWMLGHDPVRIAICGTLALGLGLLLHYGYFWLRKRHGLGFGDVKFLAVAGIWLGDPLQLTVFIFLSGVFGIISGLAWRIFTREPRFPFGPALAASLFTLVCYPQAGGAFWNALSALLKA